MPKMIALKRFHYPSGPSGKDHEPGDEVDVLTDRDAKALRLLKVAKDPEQAAAATAPKEEETTAPRRSSRSSYRRSDMTAAEDKSE